MDGVAHGGPELCSSRLRQTSDRAGWGRQSLNGRAIRCEKNRRPYFVTGPAPGFYEILNPCSIANYLPKNQGGDGGRREGIYTTTTHNDGKMPPTERERRRTRYQQRRRGQQRGWVYEGEKGGGGYDHGGISRLMEKELHSQSIRPYLRGNTWLRIFEQGLTAAVPTQTSTNDEVSLHIPPCGTCSNDGLGITALAVATNISWMQEGSHDWTCSTCST